MLFSQRVSSASIRRVWPEGNWGMGFMVTNLGGWKSGRAGFMRSRPFRNERRKDGAPKLLLGTPGLLRGLGQGVVEGVGVLAGGNEDGHGAGDAGQFSGSGAGDDGDGKLEFALLHGAEV